MKILHTADIHLKEYGDERWKSLEIILNTAKEKDIPSIIIAGDLLDRQGKIHILRNPLRELFAQFEEVTVFIIPGNHDVGAFLVGTDLGENVRILNKSPFQIERSEEAIIIGIPYQKKEDELIPHFFDILDMIKIDQRGPKILAVHGTIIGGKYSFTKGFGDEEKYNPIHYKDIEKTPIDYFALGHIHQLEEPFITDSSNKIIAGYPGSPVSIAKDEIGERKVIVLDVKDGEFKFHEEKINSFHWERENITVSPYYESQMLKKLKEVVENFKGGNARLSVTIDGYTIYPEQELTREIKEIIHHAHKGIELSSVKFGTVSKTYGIVMGGFFEKLDERDIPVEIKEECRRIFCRALSELK